MKLCIETRPSAGEEYRGFNGRRYEVELGFDASGSDYVSAMAAFMFSQTFMPESILDAFDAYVDENKPVEDMEDDDDWVEKVAPEEK